MEEDFYFLRLISVVLNLNPYNVKYQACNIFVLLLKKQNRFFIYLFIFNKSCNNKELLNEKFNLT